MTERVDARFEQLLRAVTPHLTVVPALLALNVLVFLAFLLRVDEFTVRTRDVLAWGGNYGPRTLGGQPWRLLVSTFLHLGAIHLAGNMVALWHGGTTVERIFGPARFAAIYLAAASCGSVASVAVHPWMVSAGASGGVFGVYGALGAFLLRHRGTIPRAVAGSLGLVGLGVLGCNVVLGFLDPGIDMAGHLGGLLGGAAAGAFLARPLEPGRQGRARAPKIVAAVAIALAAAACLALPTPMDLRNAVVRLSREEARLGREYRRLLTIKRLGPAHDDEVAARIDEVVLRRWRAARQQFAGARPWAPPEQEIVDRVMRHADAREERWAAVVAALRSHDLAAAAEASEREGEASTLREELERWAKSKPPSRSPVPR